MTSLLGRLLGPDVSRWMLAARCPPGPLKDYYRQDTPTLDKSYKEVGFLAIDLETTGLNPDQDEIVSMGWVAIEQGRIRLSEAEHHLVRPSKLCSDESVKVHGLVDQKLAEAEPIEAAMPHLLAALRGRIAVAHHALIEREFLSRACRRLYGHPLEVPFVDTMMLEKRALDRREKTIGDGSLKLAACRGRYGLPLHKAHDALTDAIACGELMLAQASHRSGKKAAPLRDLMF